MVKVDILAQIVGLFGVTCLLLAFQFNKRRTILLIQLLSGFVWTIHYVLLGALTGAGLNLLAAARSYLFDKYRAKRWVYWTIIGAFIIATLVTWKNWTSILPLIGSIIGTTSLWQKKPRLIRFTYILVPPFWFVYNFLNGSYPGMIGDTITFCSIVIGICRFDFLPYAKKRFSRRRQSN